MKQKKNNNVNKILRRMLPGIMAMCIGIGTIMSGLFGMRWVQAKEPKKIRFGICNGLGYYSMDENGKMSGYGYEYMMELSKYGDFEFEFVTDNPETGEKLTVYNILTLLENGELDMIGPVCGGHDDPDSSLYYSEYEIGMTYAILTTRKDTAYENNAPETYDGMTVGILFGSSRNMILRDYVKDQRIKNVTYKEYYNASDLEAALESNEVDAAFSDNIWNYRYDRELLRLEPSDCYFAFPKENAEVKAVIDAAQKQMLEAEPYYLFDLQKKYYKVVQSELKFTEKEKEYIASNPRIVVGIPLDLPPIVYKDSKTGEITGVLIDVLKDVEIKTGLHFELLDLTSLNQMIDGIAGNHLIPDMYLDLPADPSWTELFNVRLTSPILFMDMSMVARENYHVSDMDRDTTIAVLNRSYLARLVEQTYPNAEVIRCADYIDCVEAVRKGKADITFVPQVFSSLMQNKTQYRNLKMLDAGEFGYSISFGISDNDSEELYTIVNKAIDSIAEDQIRRYIMDRSLNYEVESGFVDFLYKNSVMVIIVILTFMFMLIMLIVVMYRGSQKAKKVRRSDSEKFNQALDNTKIRVWDYDIKKRILTLHMQGENEQTMVIKNMPDTQIENGVIHPDSEEAYRELYKALNDGEHFVSREIQMRDSTGEFHWVKITYTVADKVNNRYHAIAVTENIDEQKRAEQNYRAEQVLRQNMARAAMSYFTVNLTLDTVEEAATKVDGEFVELDVENMDNVIYIISKNMTSESEKSQVKDCLNIDRLKKNHGDGVDYQKQKYYFLREDGEPEWHELVMRIVENPFSHELILYLFVQNIDQKQRELLIEENIKRMMKRAMDEAFVLLLFTDPNRKEYHILNNSVNEEIPVEGSFETLLSYLREIIHEDDYRVLYYLENPDRMEAALRNRESIRGEARFRFANQDGYEWYELTARSEIDELTGRLGCTIWVNNIQANKDAELLLQNALEQAKQAAKAKQDFLSNMSHEIRTPLNGIRGMLDIMDDDPQIHGNHYLEKASISANHLIGLVNDILDMSKIDSGKIELRREFVSFWDISKYLLAVIKPLADEKEIEIAYDDDHPEYEGMVTDAGRLRQIYVNLLSNAVKYTNRGGKVKVRNRYENIGDNRIHIISTVSDNGIGMSEEFLKRAFEPFEQMDSSYSRSGTGLGLAITRRLVELMGGTIGIESELGVGTTVSLEMDFEVMNEADWLASNNITAHTEIGKIDANGRRALVAEDHPINMEIAVTQLTAMGFKVDRAVNGQEVVEIFGKSEPGYYQVIFMDIMMPIIDGLEATRQIRNMDRSDAETVTIVAMTANAFAEDIDRSMKSGMDYHLSKPFDREKLKEIVGSILV